MKFRQLPLILMSVMVLIALLMEFFLSGKAQWISKIPITLFLILGWRIFSKRSDATIR